MFLFHGPSSRPWCFYFKQTTVSILKDIAKAINVNYTGTKKVLWEQICKLGNVHIVVGEGATSFTYSHVKAAEGSVSTWIILTNEAVLPIEGFDMAPSVEQGFSAPINKDNAIGAMQHNFCTALKDGIPWPVFGSKISEPMPTMPNGPTPPPLPIKEKGHPCKAA
jgi:hypothetical protein